MLDANLKTQLQGYLQNVSKPVELIASLDDGAKSAEMKALLEDIASVSDGKVSVRLDGDDARKPSFEIRRTALMMKTPYFTTAAGALAAAQAIVATVEDTLDVRPLQSYA